MWNSWKEWKRRSRYALDFILHISGLSSSFDFCWTSKGWHIIPVLVLTWWPVLRYHVCTQNAPKHQWRWWPVAALALGPLIDRRHRHRYHLYHEESAQCLLLLGLLWWSDSCPCGWNYQPVHISAAFVRHLQCRLPPVHTLCAVCQLLKLRWAHFIWGQREQSTWKLRWSLLVPFSVLRVLYFLFAFQDYWRCTWEHTVLLSYADLLSPRRDCIDHCSFLFQR